MHCAFPIAPRFSRLLFLCVCSGAGLCITVVFLRGDYKDMQTKFKQYVDYNQIFDLVTQAKTSRPQYLAQRVSYRHS